MLSTGIGLPADDTGLRRFVGDLAEVVAQAAALALGRLIRRDAEDLDRQIHHTLLTALLDHTRPVDEVTLRARALGVPLERRHLIGVVVRHRADPPETPIAEAATAATSAQARLRDLAEAAHLSRPAFYERLARISPHRRRRPGRGRRVPVPARGAARAGRGTRLLADRSAVGRSGSWG